MRKLTTKLLAALSLTILLAQPAFAAFVNEWSYSLSYSFADYWNQYSTESDFGLTLNTDETELGWGRNGTSSIGFINKTGTMATNTTADIQDHLFHKNQPIDGNSTFLQGGTLAATLTLKGTTSDTVMTFNTNLDFLFFETSNNYRAGDERNNDIFILTNPSAASGVFSYEGYDYAFSFLSGFGELDTMSLDDYDYNSTTVLRYLADLPGSVVSTEGHLESFWFYTWYVVDSASPGTLYGWTTPENEDTYISSELTITGTPSPVPEPSTFAFLGLGLTALAFVGRRMRRQ